MSSGTSHGKSVAGARSVDKVKVCGIRIFFGGSWFGKSVSRVHSLTRGYRFPLHRVSAVPAKKGVLSRLAGAAAAAAALRDGPVTNGHFR